MVENPLKITESEHGQVITCPDYFDISVVSDARESFQRVVDGNPACITLDTDHTEMVDTAAMQLLVAFVKDAKNNGISVSYQGENDCVCRAAQALGLVEDLGLDCSQ